MEHLPDNINMVQQQTKLDQLMACFETSNVHILDLRESFSKAKASKQLYYKTDTHWNSYGAFVGYCEIIKQLSARFPVLSLPSVSDYIVQDNARTYSGDLADMLSLHDQLTEKVPSVTFKKGVYPEKSRLRKAVIFRDSFYGELGPYLSANFKEIINVIPADYFDYKTLEDDPPDVVITICAQRQISYVQSGVNKWIPVK